ncbi:ATP-binding protein [Aquimarina algiphila]|uniref:ATP-binding protein n=1 Tax=Aquimarina algiphila TaxID=2047982 RepID=UPI0024908CE4|nr:hypothetical protein [Aquimarina algiphila]
MSVIVKNIHIPIEEYDFSNHHCDENSIFIGREQAQRKLRRRIDPRGKNKDYRGAYLVAGYRGMGKSTMVDNVIRDINKNEQDSELNKINSSIDNNESLIIPVKIFLSQGELRDYDLLRQVFIQMVDKIISKREPFNKSILRVIAGIISFLLSFLIIYSLLYGVKLGIINSDHQTLITQNQTLVILFFSLIFIILFVLVNIALTFAYRKIHKKKIDLYSKIGQVKKRINSDLEVENKTTNNTAFSGLVNESSLLNKVTALIQDIGERPYKQSFNRFTTKELEFEIKEVLRLYKNVRKGREKGCILFIIDELDKLEAEFVEGENDYFELGKSRTDLRKETLSKLLANLKSFIHSADAKFIFIGGAEMYDASLADVADRESFYSSIFHEVIYVNSFFKDFEKSKTRITQMAENYLVRIILGNFMVDEMMKDDVASVNYLTLLYQKLEGIDHRERIFYQIHQFIVYLTYRSNGSPKKLKELVENYMGSLTDEKNDKEKDLILPRRKDSRSNLFLSISYKEQHKIGVLSSIFYPYMIENEKYLKELNDKNLYLSAFLMDHILKFHKSAFSWRELELMPDIIIGSKGPHLRETLKNLISYLSIKHIRRTTNAMFQFKFRSRSAMELKYISKISDESEAAFNFTLDESYHIKSFFKRKLKQKMEFYKDATSSNIDSSFINTLSYLNSTIADIHFYDEDYDAAIRYYADAIQPLRGTKDLHQHQMMLYTRNRLLLSLCLEKSKRYDSTYSILRSITLDTKEWVFDSNEDTTLKYWDYKEWESPYKRMQLFLRPHLALLMVLEKDRSDGITESNLERNIQEYTKFMGVIDLFPFKSFISGLTYYDFFEKNTTGDHKRTQTLLADYYQSVGTILYYKNRNYKSLYEKGCEGILNEFLKVGGLSKGSMKNRKIVINGVEVENLKNYSSLDNVRIHFGKQESKHYYPSFSAFFYYTTSLGHLISPYLENIKSIFELEELRPKDQIIILEKLIFETRSKHILNGKQKQFLGLVLGKLADTILSCLGNNEIKISRLKGALGSQKLHDLTLKNLTAKSWGLERKGSKERLSFNDLFSIRSVFYFNIISYRLYYQAGKYHDALFYIKKCMYIINAHLVRTRDIDKEIIIFVKNFVQYLVKESNKVLTNYTLWITKHNSLYDDIIQSVKGNEVREKEFDLISEDEKEISRIYEKINLKFHPSCILSRYKREPEIQSIFARIQFLKHKIDCCFYEQFDFLTNNVTVDIHNEIVVRKLNASFKEVNFCSKNLINIIKTYGFNYIMSYSYMGSLYYNLIKWTRLVVQLQSQEPFEETYSEWDFKDIGLLKNEVMKYYKKAIRLHSEGSEYKTAIKEMYILEDDLNDSLVHFCASLERSLINTGVIERKIERIPIL